MKVFLIVLFLFLSRSVFAVTFTEVPSLTKNGDGSWTIRFTVSELTDVAVSVVNITDSSVVRHLAAGVLGSKAPAPLTKDALAQTLTWDGKDDLGNAVTAAQTSLRARVRAGMTTQLVSLLGGEPYSIFTPAGILAGPDGSVYVAGAPANFWHEHYGKAFYTVRKFDKNGVYVKTIFPEPSNLSQSDVAGWGVVNNPDGSYSPKNVNTSLPMLTTSVLGYQSLGFNAKLQYVNAEGKLVFGSISTIAIYGDGKFPGTGAATNLMKSPAFPLPNPAYCMQGETNLLPFGNGKVLMTGLFQFGGTIWGADQTAPDTNFYRDGKIFLLDTLTGMATTWASIDSVPATSTERLSKLGGNAFYSSLQGMAKDSSGRIYVCDRHHKQVSVYDNNANLIGSLPVTYPHRVAICGRTGEIYVVTQMQGGWSGACQNTIKLVKFASFASGHTPLCTLALANTTMGRSGKSATSSIAVNDRDGIVTLWIGMWGQGVKLYRDNGTSFTLFKDMLALSTANNELGRENPTPDRLVVDTRNEKLYLSDSWYALYKVADWASPKASPCSTSARRRLYGLDWTISPRHELYVFEGQAFSAPVTRYTLDSLHAPVNFSNTGGNQLTGPVYARFAPCTGTRGLAVARDNTVAVMGLLADRTTYYVGLFPDSGNAATSYGKIQIGALPGFSGGVKFDRQANIYVGAGYRSATFQASSWFANDTGFRWGVGSVIRFKAGDSGAVVSNPTKATGNSVFNADKIYDLPLAPFSGDVNGGCFCRSPRFDLDAYGRLVLPSAVTCQVTMADNEGNIIHQFGKYGNIDSRGGLSGLPGQEVIADANVPLCWPTSAVASEDFIYVSDYMNYRIARVRMVYGADNLPGLTAHGASAREKNGWQTPLFALSSGPVPFGGRSRLTLNLPDRAAGRLDVCDVRGRVIRTLLQGDCEPGLHQMTWDGRDAAGNKVSAGLYLYKLRAGNRVLMAKTILTR